jgi:hypothetical protein
VCLLLLLRLTFIDYILINGMGKSRTHFSHSLLLIFSRIMAFIPAISRQTPRGFEAKKFQKSLRQANIAFYDTTLTQVGVDGFTKPLRAHLVASQPYHVCFESPI